MVCKYLCVHVNNREGEIFSDKVACDATTDQCPKKRLILNISPHCWRFKC